MADIEALARESGMSTEAVRVAQEALQRGGGRMAQFSHRELGGMGQWSSGGMTQIGAMGDTGLRDRVAALFARLAESPAATAPAPAAPPPAARDWWPDGLGTPSATGGQNGLRYACFPDSHRVAVEQSGQVTVYDSGAHRISGVSQQQGAGRDLVFTSQMGDVRAEDLPVA